MLITHIYGRYLSKGVLVITTAMFIVGLLIHPILAAILFIFAVLSFIPSEVLEIDTKTRKYRNTLVFFNYKKGEWKDLGNVQYLSIVNNKTSLSYQTNSKIGSLIPAPNSTSIVTNCKLRFFKKAGFYIEIDEFNKLEDAIELGKEIAKGLDLKLLNATERPPVFINL